MKKELDKKFSHHLWYKGESMTKREAIKEFARNDDIHLTQKPSKKQSDNLFDPTEHDDILRASRGTYRLTQEEKEYYMKCKEAHDNICKSVREENGWVAGFEDYNAIEKYDDIVRERYKSLKI